jgi:hypothetical protein
MTVLGYGQEMMRRLVSILHSLKAVQEFKMSPMGD